MIQYSIFKQLPPILVPGKRSGEETWQANLQYMGNVTAINGLDAIDAGRKYCAYPIVSEGGKQ